MSIWSASTGVKWPQSSKLVFDQPNAHSQNEKKNPLVWGYFWRATLSLWITPNPTSQSSAVVWLPYGRCLAWWVSHTRAFGWCLFDGFLLPVPWAAFQNDAIVKPPLQPPTPCMQLAWGRGSFELLDALLILLQLDRSTCTPSIPQPPDKQNLMSQVLVPPANFSWGLLWGFARASSDRSRLQCQKGTSFRIHGAGSSGVDEERL